MRNDDYDYVDSSKNRKKTVNVHFPETLLLVLVIVVWIFYNSFENILEAKLGSIEAALRDSAKAQWQIYREQVKIYQLQKEKEEK